VRTDESLALQVSRIVAMSFGESILSAAESALMDEFARKVSRNVVLVPTPTVGGHDVQGIDAPPSATVGEEPGAGTWSRSGAA
jgi:hypothetical protein